MAFSSPAEKKQYVNTMFARIAHRYDLMNRIMTGGQDIRWRKLLVEQAQLPPGGRLLDIATGTGDIAFAALKQHPELGYVVGADFTLPMMGVGQQRQQKVSFSSRMSWSGADTLHLPFPHNTFDAVASGFLMRNVTHLFQALAEQTRVCKAGGRVLVLDVPRPADNLFGRLFRVYFHYVVPFLGGLISGQRDAYCYLPASAEVFLRPEELKAEMEKAGLHEVRYTMLMFNTVALHVGVK
ncbi:MAG: ubiquinone/menaquinone biosynthesis methyltransferase [Anaerolineae bacterium]|nr:ubiquinone/menaquinone biosynthesis methyltransferase [Anaerolineae bacterium]